MARYQITPVGLSVILVIAVCFSGNLLAAGFDPAGEEIEVSPQKGSVVSAWVVNRALSLDGDGDYMEVADDPSLDLSSQFTIEGWFRVNTAIREYSSAIPLTKGDYGGPYWFELYPDRMACWIAFANSGEEITLGATTPDQWVHYAVTYGGGVLRGFQNGELYSHRDIPDRPIDQNDTPLTLGKKHLPQGFGSVWYNGKIDEVRIWNIVRTQEQIQAAMNTTLTRQEDGLVSYWSFDDGTPNDLSSNRNDGILHGDAQIAESRLPDEFIQRGVTSIALEDKVVNPDSQFAVNVSIFSGEPLHSFAFDLTFDPSVLKAIDVKEGSFLSRDGIDATSWQIPAIDNENGVISGIRCSRTEKGGVREKGSLASVTFEAPGMGNTDLSIQNLRLLSPTGDEMAAWTRKRSVDVYPHGSISGVILDASSKEPVEGAMVELSKDNFIFGFSTRSAGDGSYIMYGVPVGSFDVTVSRDDCIPETISGVSVEQGKDTDDVDIELISFNTASAVSFLTPIAVGEPAADFALQDIDGKQINLSDFAGKPVILHFWDSTSEHCRRQIPHLDALYRKYQNDGLAVMGISKEMANDDVLGFARSQMSYTTILNGTEAFQSYGVTSIPCTYYVDRDGKVQHRDVGFPSDGEVKMEQRVKELLTQ